MGGDESLDSMRVNEEQIEETEARKIPTGMY